MGTKELISWSLEAVNDAIAEAGLTKRALARTCGIAYVTLNRKLAGQSDLTLGELFMIAEALGRPPSAFIRS